MNVVPVSIYVVLLRHKQGAESSCCERLLLCNFRVAICGFYSC